MPQALTDAAFAPCTRVLQVPADGHGGRAINERTAQRFDLVADALLTADAGRPVIRINRARARALPMDLRVMERRRLGSQSFVVVAAADVPVEALAGHFCRLSSPTAGRA